MAAELVGLEFLKKNQIKNKTCDGERPYAFISYSHDPRDAQIVMNVFNVLYTRGYNLWIDIANMPHDENAWSECAIDALRNRNCTFAFFFRSESSMSKETIAKELETIKRLRHMRRIVTVDIWHDENNTADAYYDELLNACDPKHTVKYKACERICNIVSMANSAIRLAADVQNNILNLATVMEDELRELGVCPFKRPDIVDPPPPIIDRPEPVRLSLPEFISRHNHKTFVKSMFQDVRLVCSDEYSKYNSAEKYQSTYHLVWDFVMSILKERGEAYIHFVNGLYPESKNPPFITAKEHQRRKVEGSSVVYRRLELPGLEDWSMCIHYGQYAWVADVLRKRLQELDLPLDAFSLEYFDPSLGTDSSNGGGIKGPRRLGGGLRQKKRTLEADGYRITLFGERFEGLKLKEMMLTIFKEMLRRHPEKLDELLADLPCLSDQVTIGRDATPATFHAGEAVEVAGRSVSIGTSLGQGQVLNYIDRLMRICGEPRESLVIDGYRD